jgi:outer membrane murein-binding lipoprotein Lpp
MTLYEIDNALLECVDQETGEIIDADALNALQMERDRKLEGVALWVKDLRAEAEAISTEVKALTARKKAAENKAERLKQWLGEALEGEIFKTSKVRISYTHNTRLNVPDERELVEFLKTLEEPEKFLRFSDPELRKDEIKKALKDGYFIPGAELEQTESVVIK